MANQTLPHQPYHLVVTVAGIGGFMTTLDVGIINIALPYLRDAFHTDLTTIAWTISAYTLVLSASIIFFGRLGDHSGRLRVFRRGVIIFAAASLLCGFATHPWEIILFRVIQGVGAAMIQATAVALITTLLHERHHNRAIGTFGTLLGLGNIVGTSLGGLLISLWGWPWVFWINVPLCFYVLWGVYKIKCPFAKSQTKIDYIGIILIALFSTLLLLGIEWLANTKTRMDSLYAGIVCLALIATFIFWEKKTRIKLVDFQYFANRHMTTLSFATIAFAVTLSLYLIVPPLFLQKTTTLAPWQIGLVTFCGPFGFVLTSQSTGKLMLKYAKKSIMIVGEIIILAGMLALSFMTPNWNTYVLGALLFIVGLGGGLLFSPNIAAIMQQVPKNIQGTAGAYNRMIHNFGLSLGAGMTAFFLQVFGGTNQTALRMDGYHYIWIAGMTVVGCSLILLLIVKIKNTFQAPTNLIVLE